MATKVHMEALSPTMEEGQVVKWHKAEGDAVASGDLLAEIETDKATMELTARGDGVLRKILVGEGSTAAVGNVIAVIAAEGEDISALLDGAGSEEPPAEAAPSGKAKDGPEPEPPVEEETSVADAPPQEPEEPAGGGGRVKASPLARRLAAEAGLELSGVAGSGPGGRIVKKDVEAAREAGGRPSAAPSSAPTWSGAAEEGWDEVKVSQMRKTIAKRLTESLAPVPHFFLTIDVDMDRVSEARARVNQLLEASGEKVSINDFVLKATAVALARHPEVNAAWHGDHIRRYRHVHIGVAVAVEDGLITPVVKHADLKGLVQISREVKEMAGRARERKLKPDEYTGSTFSISNLGMFGIHEFTAVINPPEAGILAIGRTEEQAVVMAGQIVIRPRMRVTMSCDHRVVDGATGARFLQTFRGMLEEPAAMLL